MSGAVQRAAPARHGTEVSYDPMRGEWLVLSLQEDVGGMVVWTVVTAHPERARAEQAAGLHEAPVRAWLVHDPVLGWRRTAHAYVQDVGRALPHAEAEARQLQQADPRLSLFVVRARRHAHLPGPGTVSGLPSDPQAVPVAMRLARRAMGELAKLPPEQSIPEIAALICASFVPEGDDACLAGFMQMVREQMADVRAHWHAAGGHA